MSSKPLCENTGNNFKNEIMKASSSCSFNGECFNNKDPILSRFFVPTRYSLIHVVLLLSSCFYSSTKAFAMPSIISSSGSSIKSSRGMVLGVTGGGDGTDNADTTTTLPAKVRLQYFDIEGVAESVRLALILSHTPFEDERVTFPDWPALKPTLPYGQLPIMTIHDDQPGVVRTQSKAMLRYVGATYGRTGLYPSDKLFDIEEAIGLIEDLQTAFRSCFATQKVGFPDGFYETEEGKEVIRTLRTTFVTETLPKYLQYITNMLQKNNNEWLASTSTTGPTIADCYAVPVLRSYTRGTLDHFPTTCLDAYPEIISYIKRFCALPPIEGRYTNGVY